MWSPSLVRITAQLGERARARHMDKERWYYDLRSASGESSRLPYCSSVSRNSYNQLRQRNWSNVSRLEVLGTNNLCIWEYSMSGPSGLELAFSNYSYANDLPTFTLCVRARVAFSFALQNALPLPSLLSRSPLILSRFRFPFSFSADCTITY